MLRQRIGTGPLFRSLGTVGPRRGILETDFLYLSVFGLQIPKVDARREPVIVFGSLLHMVHQASTQSLQQEASELDSLPLSLQQTSKGRTTILHGRLQSNHWHKRKKAVLDPWPACIVWISPPESTWCISIASHPCWAERESFQDPGKLLSQ